MARRARARPASLDPATAAFHEGWAALRRHPLFGELLTHVRVVRDGSTADLPGLTAVTAARVLHASSRRRAPPAEWEWALAHSLGHLAFDHVRPMLDGTAWQAAACIVVNRLLAGLHVGEPPLWARAAEPLPGQPEAALYRRFLVDGVPPALARLGSLESGGDMVVSPAGTHMARSALRAAPGQVSFPELFGAAVNRAVADALTEAGLRSRIDNAGAATPTAQAMEWFIDSYPLLGALAAGFRLVDDVDVCRRTDIGIAAVNATLREIYVNPMAQLGVDGWRFVLAHELLHVALDHAGRCGSREPELWNAACDFAVNGWLIEMRLGHPPGRGLLHDAGLAGLSAETIYDRLATLGRRARRLLTLRGAEGGDMLAPTAGTAGDLTDADAFVREALARGLRYHEASGRGLLPAGLAEEIRSVIQPPVPWDVELAVWFQEHVRLPDAHRTYGRISRRQSATPDIPRPGRSDLSLEEAPTFAVIVDTSASMSRRMLGMCRPRPVKWCKNDRRHPCADWCVHAADSVIAGGPSVSMVVYDLVSASALM